MPESHDEALARMRAEADQARQGVSEFGGILAMFFQSCRDNGFGRREALALTQTFLATQMANHETGDDE